MIYTVTLNPSLDYITRLTHLKLGETNRSDSQIMYPGGKGINVSRLLAHLAIANTAWGFLGGYTGQHLQATLSESHIHQNFTTIAGNTRINIKIKAAEETEINATGPHISDDEVALFLSHFDVLTAQDIVILSGSVPKNLNDTIYQKMLDKIQERQAAFVIDTTGEQLQLALRRQPLLVKPNRAELAQLYQVSLTQPKEVIRWGQQLLKDGARYAIVSLAGDGAILFTTTGQYFAQPVVGKVANSVGAGDSMIAGFVGTWLTTGDVMASFRMAVASGTATAFSDDIATQEKINAVYEQVIVTPYDM
ncbi:1-phosphofructokinase [Leuconostoc citreum]|uniref:1-phosphofructokinase n=1 Tax=Leuconostoc citreum TaxID=33964 RepID=UPI000246566B|nr:1-phosphofructokinase [Leuconostoc citreum]MCT3077635.1 1-phosphofructokinase [Leuconostoc citreum]CCF26458.1 Fructose 1-phosphate kinase [Leuconostoc citreum LBAE C11]